MKKGILGGAVLGSIEGFTFVVRRAPIVKS